jgi:hypothetical protein
VNIIPVLSWFRKPKPIPYMQRADVKAALNQQRAARAKHLEGANAVYDLTHELLRREVRR